MSDTGLSGGQESVTYTVVSGDTTATIATKLAAAISSDASLQTLGVNASAASGLIKIRSVSPNITTYAASTSVGATEVVTLNVSGNQIQNAVIGTLGAGYLDLVKFTTYYVRPRKIRFEFRRANARFGINNAY